MHTHDWNEIILFEVFKSPKSSVTWPYVPFSGHRENILKTAKALVEDTKTLVAGAASSQEQLAVAAQNAVSTIVQLSDVVKAGAASLGSQNQEAQVASRQRRHSVSAFTFA